MRKAACIIILSLFTRQTSAQFNLEFHSGYGSYSNGELKKYQTSLTNNIFLPGGKVLESFPAFWYYGVDAKWNRPKSQVGLSLSQGSTGGQFYYADYSGTFKEQQLLKYTAVRILMAARLPFNNGTTSIQVDPRFGLAFGTLKITRSIAATDGTVSFNSKQAYRYKAVNPFCEPTFSISQKLGIVSISVFVGYHFDLASNLYRTSNGGSLVFDGTEVSMNLSGVRAGGSVGFFLGRAKETAFTRVYVGPGVGIDFGGIGLNAMSMLTERVGLFGALGYNFDNIGLNGGVRLYTTNQIARWRPFFSAMYGYNAVYLIKNAENFNRTFYGTTIGVGVDLKTSSSNFWTFALQIPIRSDDVKAYKTYLENSNIEIKRDLLPIAISIGYRIAILD
jgi:hypothetical protein